MKVFFLYDMIHVFLDYFVCECFMWPYIPYLFSHKNINTWIINTCISWL